MNEISETVNDRFVRWQGYTLEQLGYVNNLLLGIAVAALGFQINLMYEENFKLIGVEKDLYVFSVILLFISIVFGVMTGFSRLIDFRLTTEVIKSKGLEQQTKRDMASKYGQRTWSFISIQAGAIALAFPLLTWFYACQFISLNSVEK